jgi:hypothetical protein
MVEKKKDPFQVLLLIDLEVSSGFEPLYEVLQTSA